MLVLPAITNRITRCGDPAADRGLGDDPSIPDGRDELVLRHDAFAVTDEIVDQIEDLGLDSDRVGAAPEFPSVGVKRAVLE